MCLRVYHASTGVLGFARNASRRKGETGVEISWSPLVLALLFSLRIHPLRVLESECECMADPADRDRLCWPALRSIAPSGHRGQFGSVPLSRVT